MNFGRFNARDSTKVFNNDCPAFNALFLPLRSTIRPLFNTIFKFGGMMDPSRVASDGLKFSPPNAHAMESSTDVLPWLFLPPMTVRPFAVGSSFTALIRLTFSISSLLIFTDIFLILLVFVKVIPNRPCTAAHFVCNLFIGPSGVSKRRHLSSVQLPLPALSNRAFRGGR